MNYNRQAPWIFAVAFSSLFVRVTLSHEKRRFYSGYYQTLKTKSFHVNFSSFDDRWHSARRPLDQPFRAPRRQPSPAQHCLFSYFLSILPFAPLILRFSNSFITGSKVDRGSPRWQSGTQSHHRSPWWQRIH